MKKVKWIFVCCFVLLLTGCIDNELGDENEDKANVCQNYLNYKQDVYCEWGKQCAFYEDRIYYFQNEDEPGIYSMDTRGKDRRLEVRVSNIRKLQVREDGIYYVGPIEGTYPTRYTIYRKEWNVPKAYEYSVTYPELESGEENAWDFYINENNTMVVLFVYTEIPHMNLIFQAFMLDSNGQPISLSEYDNYLEEYNPGKIDNKNTNLFGYDDLLIMNEIGLEGWRKDVQGGGSNEYVVNMNQDNMTVFHKDKNEQLVFRNNAVYHENYMDSVLQTIYEGCFVIANGNQLQWVQSDDAQMVRKVELPEAVAVRYSVRDDSDLLVIAEGEKTECIYRISLDTTKIETTYTVPKKQKVLALSDNMLYTVSDKALYVYKNKNDEYEEQKSINWQNKLKKTSKLEMCGNVIFVYDVDDESGEFVLKEYQVLDTK